jgi:hypothetical protein
MISVSSYTQLRLHLFVNFFLVVDLIVGSFVGRPSSRDVLLSDFPVVCFCKS